MSAESAAKSAEFRGDAKLLGYSFPHGEAGGHYNTSETDTFSTCLVGTGLEKVGFLALLEG